MYRTWVQCEDFGSWWEFLCQELTGGGTGGWGVLELHPDGSFCCSGAQTPLHGLVGFGSKSIEFLGNRVHYCCFFLTKLFSAFQFFAPLRPTRILVEYNSHGDATGEADVHFESHKDAVAAMAKEGSKMGKSEKQRGSYSPGIETSGGLAQLVQLLWYTVQRDHLSVVFQAVMCHGLCREKKSNVTHASV